MWLPVQISSLVLVWDPLVDFCRESGLGCRENGGESSRFGSSGLAAYRTDSLPELRTVAVCMTTGAISQLLCQLLTHHLSWVRVTLNAC